MENVTLGQIGLAVTFLVGLITGLGYLKKHLKDWVGQAVKDQIDTLKTDIDGVKKRLDDVDMESCKNFLVVFLSDVEKKTPIDEIQKERFWEQYEHYTKNGGNSYIRRKVEQLKSEGKL